MRSKKKSAKSGLFNIPEIYPEGYIVRLMGLFNYLELSVLQV
jgi:hypothetical protein